MDLTTAAADAVRDTVVREVVEQRISAVATVTAPPLSTTRCTRIR